MAEREKRLTSSLNLVGLPGAALGNPGIKTEMKMLLKRGDLKKFAERIGVSSSCACLYLYGRRKPPYKKAKILEGISGIPVEVWLEGPLSELRKAAIKLIDIRD